MHSLGRIYLPSDKGIRKEKRTNAGEDEQVLVVPIRLSGQDTAFTHPLTIMSFDTDASTASFATDGTSNQERTLEGRVPSCILQESDHESDLSASENEDLSAQSEEPAQNRYGFPPHFYDHLMSKSFVELKGETVGYVEGAIYLRNTWVLVLVTTQTSTSQAGCWVLKGACGATQREQRDRIIEELCQCWTQTTEGDGPGWPLVVKLRSDLIQGKDVVDWVHHNDADPETIPTW
jgi:hypothetical protein